MGELLRRDAIAKIPQHTCVNATGGTRCDTCFGPIEKSDRACVELARRAAGKSVTANVTQRLLPQGAAERKGFPMCTGLLDYFPDALAAVAEVSFHGNEKHNPGEQLHWARGKSMDHADCIVRHLVERCGFDGPMRHTACLAWRALALLQEELEAAGLAGQPRGARNADIA